MPTPDQVLKECSETLRAVNEHKARWTPIIKALGAATTVMGVVLIIVTALIVGTPTLTLPPHMTGGLISEKAAQAKKTAALVASDRADVINDERRRNTFNSCLDANLRHTTTAGLVRSSYPPGRTRTVILALVDTLAPFTRDCVAYADQRVSSNAAKDKP